MGKKSRYKRRLKSERARRKALADACETFAVMVRWYFTHSPALFRIGFRDVPTAFPDDPQRRLLEYSERLVGLARAPGDKR